MNTSGNTSDLTELLRSVPFLGEADVSGKKVFVRTDFNVPLDENGSPADDGRLQAVLPTINHLLDRGAAVIIGSHLRNPLDGDGRPDPKYSFAPLARRLSRIWEMELSFRPDLMMGPSAQAAARKLLPGQVMLLENLRFHPGEITGDPALAKELAAMADIYVNDAFGVCHRAHASMTSMVRFMEQAYGGLALKNELMALNRALSSPARPLAAVIGGRNVEAKLPVINALMARADYVLLGGQMGDAFSRLALGEGLEHLSLTPESLEEMRDIISRRREYRAKLFFPVDKAALSAEGDVLNIPAQNLTADIVSKDIGPATRLLYSEALNLCRTIIWNGPMGAYETPAFAKGTALITRALANCPGVTLAGGVDTNAAILKMSDRSQVSFLSTGGSAFLKALAGQPLVALEFLAQTTK